MPAPATTAKPTISQVNPPPPFPLWSGLGLVVEAGTVEADEVFPEVVGPVPVVPVDVTEEGAEPELVSLAVVVVPSEVGAGPTLPLVVVVVVGNSEEELEGDGDIGSGEMGGDIGGEIGGVIVISEGTGSLGVPLTGLQ